ncbi:4Fe-4S dicluster domain-containing protein [Geobacter pelophilus]|uniref:4Fe-4S dicluster domain-containing protein n=1 Tax=Geoanaerobacter pelophilus TaxID=60036 RepID=A0AAW4L2N5_9BACT|nr:4Fe-4S dicluster domain-containing protein [Geoanaerobacter pelophilus]MBT0665236.1 4Fe-4S dicluster domain-containing protein [Geoanaerobacter pelophilus]
MISRRNFCKKAMLFIGGVAVPVAGLEIFNPQRLLAEKQDPAKVRWVFLVDTRKCVGCGFCVRACKLENEIPYDANVSRTWVERYVVTRDGKVHTDSPKAARDGFTTKAIDQAGKGMLEIRDEDITKAFFVPKLCNQCENPPCVQVCPVGATYQTPDGVVLVDRTWCIGCGYCVMGCPYGVRFFHPVYKAAEKCNFCYHRISKGMKSACVEACPFGARTIGNIKDPEDPVTRIIMTERVAVLKEEYGTKPQVFYLGMSKEVK